MGDFERTFGAGADFDAIVEGFSASAAGQDDDREVEILYDGRELPPARSFYDRTGLIWHPCESPRARIRPAILAEIDDIAREVAAQFNADVPDWGFQWAEIAQMFLERVVPALDEFEPTLDTFEVLLARVVRESCVPIVFARDVGPNSGYVSRTLSTHVFAFPEEVYLARFGTLSLEGPFTDFRSFGGYAIRRHDSYCEFVNEDLGREVVEISEALRDPEVPIRTAREWIEAEKPVPGAAVRGHNSFATLAHRAASRQPRSRLWSDAAEDFLRARIRGIVASVIPEQARITVMLNPSVFSPWLDCSLHWQEEAHNDPRNELIVHLIDAVDVSNFRGVSPPILILDHEAFSPQERMTGVEVLFGFLENLGVDMSAAADAFSRSDFLTLLRILSRDANDRAYEEEAHAFAPEATLVRHGLTAEEIPF